MFKINFTSRHINPVFSIGWNQRFDALRSRLLKNNTPSLILYKKFRRGGDFGRINF